MSAIHPPEYQQSPSQPPTYDERVRREVIHRRVQAGADAAEARREHDVSP
jgi:hypothetical protein